MKTLKESMPIYTTEERYDQEEAINRRLKQLEPRVFGLRLAKYHLLEAKKVYTPYYKVRYRYEFSMKNKLSKRESILRRDVTLIVDGAEGRTYVMEYDEKLPLKTVDRQELTSALSSNFSFEQAREKAYEYLRWRVIAKIHRQVPQISLIATETFYRPMWKMKLLVWGREVTKMAEADGFSVSKASLQGLKK